MDKNRKKELIRTYKEMKPNPGVFAVRCKPTGEAWVASSPNLDRQQGGVWSQLRMGGNRFTASLHAAWKEHGESAFTFEVLEEVRDDNALMIPALLKERAVHWRRELGGAALIG